MRVPADGADDEGITDINVTPLVDVMMVLLVIFIVTASMMLTRAIPVKLPASDAGGAAHRAALQVAYRIDGIWMVEGKRIGEADLATRIRTEVAHFPGLRVDLAADSRLEYGKVVSALDFLRKQGVRQVALSTAAR